MSQAQAVYEVDPIMYRYNALSLMNIIPSMSEYAIEWQRLAMDADIAGRPSTAEACRSRAKYYCRLAQGDYIRLVEGCLAELIPVALEIPVVYILAPAESETTK